MAQDYYNIANHFTNLTADQILNYKVGYGILTPILMIMGGFIAERVSDQANRPRWLHTRGGLNFIEFCVELDNEDDRLKHPENEELRAQIDDELWDPAPLFERRKAIAEDYAKFKAVSSVGSAVDPRTSDDDIRYWSKLFDKLNVRARKDGISPSPTTNSAQP